MDLPNETRAHNLAVLLRYALHSIRNGEPGKLEGLWVESVERELAAFNGGKYLPKGK